MKELISSLPTPVARYKGLEAQFEIYRAKDMHKTAWNGRILKELVLVTRSAYSRYGNRPLLDAYDTKAAIYLVRVRYAAKKSGSELNEWLSIRMVPGDGKPFGVGEPEIYQYKGVSMDKWIGKKLAARNMWKAVASSSRMCGTPVYELKRDGAINIIEGASHHYTGICFALIHKQFLMDYPLERFPYRHITAIIRPDFYKKGLGHTFKDGKTLYPQFTPAYKFLGVDRSNVRVKKDIYSYEYPTYWLNKRKLLRLINDLRKKAKQPSISSIQPGILSPLATKSKQPVSIADISISPVKMRKLVDKFVPDVPELKITEASVWYKSMDKLINAGKLQKIS